MIADFLSLFFPYTCHICDKTIAKGILCSRCAPKKVEQALWPRCTVCFCHLEAPDLSTSGRCFVCDANPPPFGQCRYIFEYSEGLRHTLRYTKYHPSYLMAKELCCRGLEVARDVGFLEQLLGYDLITVIPPSLKGFWRRDFHLPALLAHTLWTALNKKRRPQLLHTLKHDWYITPQASLRVSKRILNMKERWSVCKNVSGKKVLLLDDVITTGSSVISAAKSLVASRAASVDILALTRSPVFEKVRERVLIACSK
jgi:predicted amidophosphoribosyltransferase